MQSKRVFSALLVITVLFSIVGCGKTRDELIETVSKYQIFSKEFRGCKTIYDFEKYMDDFNEENDDLLTVVSSTYNVEPFIEENIDEFINELQENTDFSYDKEKDYVRLNIYFDHYLVSDDEIVYEREYSYIFSVDKNNFVSPEAWGYTTDDGGYSVNLNSSYLVEIGMKNVAIDVYTSRELIYEHLIE